MRSNSALELDSLELASEEQDLNGEAGESLVAEKSTGNDFSNADWVLTFDVEWDSTSNSLFLTDCRTLPATTPVCVPPENVLTLLVAVSSGGSDTDNG